MFLYVGHDGWGKSETLRKITENDKKKKIVTITDQQFFVKKMSNESKLLKYAKSVDKSKYDNHVLAFCPNQLERFDSLIILRTLEKSNDLYFYIQKYCPDSVGEGTDIEINCLKKFVKVCINQSIESSSMRAEKLILFIEDQFKPQDRFDYI